jgi:hypothetical protein
MGFTSVIDCLFTLVTPTAAAAQRNLGLSLTLVRKYILTEMSTSYTYLRDTACPQILPILDVSGVKIASLRLC